MANRSKIKWPTIDGRAEEYELWEEQILCCMHAAGLKQFFRSPLDHYSAEQQA